jgi:hypothetical protein
MQVFLIMASSFLGYSAFAANDAINGYLGARSNQLSSEVGDVQGNRFRADLRFDFHKDKRAEKGLETRFTTMAEVNDQSLTTYSVPEAYVGARMGERDLLYAGRIVLDWAPMDATWGFGKLNNRINFDYFVPGQEGLVGINYEHRFDSGFRAGLFASGLYAPELNPPLDIDKKDQTIKSRHPWADVPAQEAETDPGVVKRIAYDVDYPEIESVIYRGSFGWRVAMDTKHWLLDYFIMRKPENQFSTRVRGRLDNQQDVIKAYVTPQFYYHTVTGSTLKYRNYDWEVYASGFVSRPDKNPDSDKEVTLATDIKTEKYTETYGGGGISKVNSEFGIGINYIARLSSFKRSKKNLAQDPRWNQAVNVFLTKNFTRTFSLTGDVKYDTFTTDRLFMASAGWQMAQHLHVSLGVNLIGTPANGKSYWSPYTNNDSIYAQLRYLF